jgi:hypothetical protein
MVNAPLRFTHAKGSSASSATVHSPTEPLPSNPASLVKCGKKGGKKNKQQQSQELYNKTKSNRQLKTFPTADSASEIGSTQASEVDTNEGGPQLAKQHVSIILSSASLTLSISPISTDQ